MKLEILALIVTGAALSTTANSQTLPPPPTTINQAHAAQCSSTVAPYSKKKTHDLHTQVYGPQAGFVILNYNVYDLGSFGTTTENYTSAPAGVYVSNTNFTNTFNSAFNLVASSSASGNAFGLSASGASDINVALSNAYNVYMSYNVALASSFGNITLETDAKGNGLCVPTGSACALGLDVTLLQVDPCLMSGTSFDDFIMNWTKKTISAYKNNPRNWGTMLCSVYAAPARQLQMLSNQSTTHFLGKQIAGLADESARLAEWKPIPMTTDGKRGAFSVGPDQQPNCIAVGRYHPAPGPEWLSLDQVRAKIKSDLVKLAGSKDE